MASIPLALLALALAALAAGALAENIDPNSDMSQYAYARERRLAQRGT